MEAETFNYIVVEVMKKMSMTFKRPQQLSPVEIKSILMRYGIHLIPFRKVSDDHITRTWELTNALRVNSSFIYINEQCEGILSYHAPQYIYNFRQDLNWDDINEQIDEALSWPKRLGTAKSQDGQVNIVNQHLSDEDSSRRDLISYLVTTSSLPSPSIIMKWIKEFDLRPISFLEGWEVSIDDYVTWIENHQMRYDYLALRKVDSTNPNDKAFNELLSLDRTLRGLRRSRSLVELIGLEGMEAFLVLRERKPVGYAIIDQVTGMIGPANTINDELVDVLALLGVEILSKMRSNALCFYTHSLSLINEKEWLENNFKIVKILNTFMSDIVGRFDFYMAPNLLLL